MAATEKIVALIGGNGMLAQMVRRLAPTDYAIYGYDLPELDLTDADQVTAAMRVLRPQVIINCAAYTDVDGCESHQDLALRVNGDGPGTLATVALELNATLVHISTDYVFPGTGHAPLLETDPTGPVSVYGQSKLAGEQAILQSGLKNYFIVRTSWLYGPGGNNFVETMLRVAGEREELRVVADQIGSPTYTGDLATAVFHLLDAGQAGLYHFANDGQCSWHQFSEEIFHRARQLGCELKVQQVEAIRTEEYPLPAPRPAWSVLSKEKYRRVTGAEVPRWENSLEKYLQERDVLTVGK